MKEIYWILSSHKPFKMRRRLFRSKIFWSHRAHQLRKKRNLENLKWRLWMVSIWLGSIHHRQRQARAEEANTKVHTSRRKKTSTSNTWASCFMIWMIQIPICLYPEPATISDSGSLSWCAIRTKFRITFLSNQTRANSWTSNQATSSTSILKSKE